MNAYANDHRVRWVNEYFCVVDVDGDTYDVHTSASLTDWYASPSIGSRSWYNAGLRNRDDVEAWAKRTKRGPFGSADEALYSLIGVPR